MRYEITAPDGRRFEIEAPEGMSPDVLSREVETAFGGAPAAPQPIGVGERMAYGAGDVARGATQYLAETGRLLPPEQTSIGRVLRRNPNLRAVMEAGAEAVPFPTAEGARTALREGEAAYQARRTAGGDTGFDWARMAGGVVPAALATAALRAPVTLPGAVAQGGILGAAQGAAMPALGEPETPERAREALSGLLFGGLGGAAGQVIGRAIAPRVDPNVQALRAAGVELTPGQVLGGTARATEERLSGTPIVGGAIQAAQERGVESLNTAVANRVLAPLNAQVPADIKVGRDLVSHVADTVGDTYKSIGRGITPFGLDRQFADDVTNISQNFLAPDMAQRLARSLERDVVRRIQSNNGRVDGDTYLTIVETLGKNAREYLSSATPAERELGRAFAAMRDSFDSLLARTNPDLADQVTAARQAYRGLVTMERAAANGRNGVFTPDQFSAAVRDTDLSARGAAFARGRPNMQDISDPAVAAMVPSSSPVSMADRMLLGGMGVGAAGAGALSPEVMQALSLAALGTAGAYSAPGTRAFMSAVTAPRPAAVRGLGDLVARSGGAVGGTLNTMPPEYRRGLLD